MPLELGHKPKLAFALEHAAAGIPVFPCRPGTKIPFIKSWKAHASTDESVIRRWWGLWPDANIAGPANIIDVDIKRGKPGEETFAQLDFLYGFPPTWEQRTASGGRQLWYDDATPLKNSQEKLGKGLDTRGSESGYGLLPGSIVNGNPYAWVDGHAPKDIPRATAPKWIPDLLGEYEAPSPKEHAIAKGVTLDTPDAITRAAEWLATFAPEAVEGSGGDATTYWVASRVIDFGLSAEATFDLLVGDGGWNENKASPSWGFDDLKAKVDNAYAYRQNPVGSSNPAADFEPIEDTPPGADPFSPSSSRSPIEAIPYDFEADISAIPPRRWLIMSLAVRGYVSILIAPPGVGKTTYTGQVALAAAAGNGAIAGIELHESALDGLNIWTHNNEDDMDELNRRFAAARIHHGLRKEHVKGSLYATSGDMRQLLIAKRHQDRIVPADVELVVDEILAKQIDVFIVDPFLETHEANENDNREINTVARMYREVAQRTGCAVILVHHTNKPPGASAEGRAGNMDTARGASSLLGVARIAKTLYEMSAKDAQTFGVSDGERHLYVRLDDAKANMSLKSSAASWLRRVTVTLPNGDEVGVLAPADLCVREEQEEGAVARQVMDLVRAAGGHTTVNALTEQMRPLFREDPMAAPSWAISRAGKVYDRSKLHEKLKVFLEDGPYYIVENDVEYEVKIIQQREGLFAAGAVLCNVRGV